MEEDSVKRKRTKKLIGSLEFELKKMKLSLAEVNQLKTDLDAAKQARDAIYAVVTQIQGKVVTAEAALVQL